jgi:RHS repeat-associated protein
MLLQQDQTHCRYEYDPLDRLVGLKPLEKEKLQRFYCKNRLVTEIQCLNQYSIVQQSGQVLAQQIRQGETVETNLLITDRLRSVLNTTGEHLQRPITYTPYGHRHPESGLTSMLGFNGERPDLITGNYLLGNGYRAFNPVLMRFNSPDSLSPFDKGGLNSYVYCLGDPVNMSDPTGNVPWFNLTTLQLRELSVAARAAGTSHQGFFPRVEFFNKGVDGKLILGEPTKLSNLRRGYRSWSISPKVVENGPKRLSILSGEVIHEYAHVLEMPPGTRTFMRENFGLSKTDILERFSKLRKNKWGHRPELPDEFGSFKRQWSPREKVHEQIQLLPKYAGRIRSEFSPSKIADLQYGFPYEERRTVRKFDSFSDSD